MQETQTKENVLQNNNKPYFWGLDLIRIIAMFFVILVHSTSFYGFKGTEINSFFTFLAGLGRYLSFTCIPLFLILTGYLNHSKEPSKKYYLKLIKILIEFILCGVVVAIFNKIYFNNPTSVLNIVTDILCLGYPSYSWYINMFVGLYLLIPFFNYAYNAIPDKYKWLLILSLILIFSSPTVITYWTVAYPIMYYFIGLFLKDKQFKINKILLLVVLLLVCLAQTGLAIIPATSLYGENHNNLLCVIASVSIFLLFYNLKTENPTKLKSGVTKFLRTIANASLATFLISQIFESLTSVLFNKLSLTTFNARLPFLAYLTPVKFLISVICALLINFIAGQIYKFLLFIINKK